MYKNFKIVSIATMLAVLVAVVPAAHGSTFLGSIYVNDADNLFEDQDRDAIVDVNGNDALDVGDVFLGFARIDDHAAPAGSFGALGNRVYAVFTQQIAAIIPPGGPGTGSRLIFEPTTVAGLTLADLIGMPTPANSFSATFDNVAPFPVDLINASPGDENGNGTVNMFDYIAEIVANAGPAPQPSNIAGLRPGQATVGLTGPTALLPDYLIATNTPTADALLAIGGLSALPTLGLGIQIATFTAGLEILVNNDPNVADYARVVAATETVLIPDASDPSGFIRHEQAVVGGTVVGAAGSVNQSEWSHVHPDFGTAANSPGGVVTNADFVVHPLLAEIPEPTAFLVWLVGLLMAGIYRSERQQ
jgi:hypothetical protein